MANISLTEGNLRDGTKALNRSGDNLQLSTVTKEDSTIIGQQVHIPVVTLDGEAQILDILQEQSRLLRIMNTHLAKITEMYITDEDVEDEEVG